VALTFKILVSWLRWKALRIRTADFHPAAVRTIAVIELTRLGDFLSILPAIRRFKSEFPKARIHVVTNSQHIPLLAMCDPDIRVIGIANSTSMIRFFRALLLVRRLAPDLACSMSPSNRNALMALSSTARFIVGYLNGSDSLTPFLGVNPVEAIGVSGTGDHRYGRENIHGRSWKVLEALGIPRPHDPFRPFRSWRPDGDIVARLQEQGMVPLRPLIAIHPFSRWKYRSWPIDEFERLIRLLRSEANSDIVVICHESENEALLPLRTAFGRDPRGRFFPSTDLLETAAVLQDVDLFIGNDSGPIHLAALLNLPVVGLYGPAPPALAAPLAARGTFLYHAVPCSPCSQTECIMPERHCMRLITAEEVLAAALRELTLLRTRGIAANG